MAEKEKMTAANEIATWHPEMTPDWYRYGAYKGYRKLSE